MAVELVKEEENPRYKKIRPDTISPLEAIISIGIAEAVGKGGYRGVEKFYESKDAEKLRKEKLRERRREMLLSLMPKMGNSDSATAQHLAKLQSLTNQIGNNNPELVSNFMKGYKANPKAFGEAYDYIRSVEKNLTNPLSAEQFEQFFTMTIVNADNPEVNSSDILKSVLDPTIDLADAETFVNIQQDVRNIKTSSDGAFLMEADQRLLAGPSSERIKLQSDTLKGEIYERARNYIGSINVTKPPKDFDELKYQAIEDALNKPSTDKAAYTLLSKEFGKDAIIKIMTQAGESKNQNLIDAIRFNTDYQNIWFNIETTFEDKDGNDITTTYRIPTRKDVLQLEEGLTVGVKDDDGNPISKETLRQLFNQVYGPYAAYRALGY